MQVLLNPSIGKLARGNNPKVSKRQKLKEHGSQKEHKVELVQNVRVSRQHDWVSSNWVELIQNGAVRVPRQHDWVSLHWGEDRKLVQKRIDVGQTQFEQTTGARCYIYDRKENQEKCRPSGGTCRDRTGDRRIGGAAAPFGPEFCRNVFRGRRILVTIKHFY